MYHIGISCIGGGVGQSVIYSCRLSGLPLKTIGFDMNPFAYGAYECDVFDFVTPVTDDDYISKLISKCGEHDIDLIIPGLDHEILLYAQNLDRFEQAGIQTIVSGAELVKLCRDKEKMCRELNKFANVFVQSYDKRTLKLKAKQGDIDFPMIAKPRGGSASKGVHIIQSLSELDSIGDDHIIQELAVPAKDDPNYDYYINHIRKNENPQVSEISIQVVTGKDGKLLGKMASYNKLKDGVPVEIVPISDEKIWKVTDKLIPHLVDLGLRGPLNIQGRLTEKGLRIFEMNPRFTGITGMRALMGFNEVEACIAEWMNISRNSHSIRHNHKRFGARQTENIAVPLDRNVEVNRLSKRLNAANKPSKDTLMVTGAESYLGRHFVYSILEENNYDLWLYGQNKEELNQLFAEEELRIYSPADLQSGDLSPAHVDILLHIDLFGCNPVSNELTNSLSLTSELFTSAAMHLMPAIVYISSKYVYGLQRDTMWNENSPVSPQTSYAQALYTGEIMLKSINRMCNQTKVTSLRLAELAGGNNGQVPIDQIAGFVQNALDGESIKILGGSGMMEKLDIRDAVTAIKAILALPENQWKQVYNVGPNRTYSAKEVAEMAVDRVYQQNNTIKPEIIIPDEGADQAVGMDCSRFMEDTGWKPVYSMEDMIDNLSRRLQAHDFNKNVQTASTQGMGPQ